MKLEAYLALHPDLTLDAFGGLVGVSGATVSRWISPDPARRQRPSWRHAARIRHATGGLVTEADWQDEAPPMPAPQRPEPCRRRARFAQAVAARRAGG